jgi:hypothetical protein
MDKDYLEYLKSLGISVARGVPQLATGFVDLAALPFTLSGLIKPEQAFGSTDWMTAKGYLPPKQEGLLNETTELLSGVINPATALTGGLLGIGSIAAKKGAKPVAALLNESQFVPGVKSGEELIVQHNLRPENVLYAEKLGGLPVPSLAVSKVGQPLENFGDITLIGSKEMAEPSAKNPVFRSDAYTARFPSVNYSLDIKSEKNLKNLFADVAPKISDGDRNFYRLTDNLKDFEYNDLVKAKFLDQIGELPNKKDFAEPWKFDSEIQSRVSSRKNEYADWLENFKSSLPSEGVNISEKLFKGFTPSGNRRYADVNLENIVKEMRGGAGSENWNYGLGNLRAVATPKFKSFSEIQTSRDKIVSPEQFNIVKTDANNAYESLLDRLSGLSGYDARDALLEVAQTKNVNVLDRIYGADNVPKELKADIGLFVQKVKAMPTEYFEIKPQRAVNLNEFKGGIIPADTPSTVVESLRRQGLQDIYFYASPEEKKELIKKFGKNMFQIGGAAAGLGTIGGLLGEENY